MLALLLEDEPLIALDVEQALHSEGFSVKTILSCVEALSWLENRRPDVAIIDLRLLDGDCTPVAKRLAEQAVPFIVHSGTARNGAVLDEVFSRGVWFDKPSRVEDLAASARELSSNGGSVP